MPNTYIPGSLIREWADQLKPKEDNMKATTDKSRARIVDASRQLANALTTLADGFDNLNPENIINGTVDTMSRLDHWYDVLEDAGEEIGVR